MEGQSFRQMDLTSFMSYVCVACVSSYISSGLTQ